MMSRHGWFYIPVQAVVYYGYAIPIHPSNEVIPCPSS